MNSLGFTRQSSHRVATNNAFFPVSDEERQQIQRRLGLQGRPILALGRMARNKGYDLLIRAMPVVFSRTEDTNLVLAIGAKDSCSSEQRQLQELKDLAKELGIAERVEFRDYIRDEDLPDYYRAAEVFALSSRYEPFGMTAIEAIACGTPTVVTTEGGLWSQLRYGMECISANPLDPEAYGHGIATVLQNPIARGQLRRHGPSRIHRDFSWGSIAKKLLGFAQSQQKVISPLSEQCERPAPHGSQLVNR